MKVDAEMSCAGFLEVGARKDVRSGSSAEEQRSRADLSGVHHPCTSSRPSVHVVTRCADSVPSLGGAR